MASLASSSAGPAREHDRQLVGYHDLDRSRSSRDLEASALYFAGELSRIVGNDELASYMEIVRTGFELR